MTTSSQRGIWVAVFVSVGCAFASLAAPPVAVPLPAYRDVLSTPARVAADASGRLFVADPQTGRIVEFDAFGRVTGVRSGFSTPLALGFDAAGHLLVGEAGSGRVRIYDAAWNVVGSLGAGDGEFQLPNFLALDPTPGSNTVYVSDSAAHVVKVYQNGSLAFSFGGQGTGPGQFDFPAGLRVTTNEVFVVDQNNDRIEVFDRSGAFLREFSLVTRIAPGLFGLAGGRSLGLCGDDAGRLYVADGYQGIVKVYDTAGTSLAAIGTLGEGVGQLRSPGGLCFDPLGRLFVASPNNSRVEVFGLDNYLYLATEQTGSGLFAAGSNLVFTVSGPGLTNQSIQWLHNGTNIAAGTNAVLSVPGLAGADAGVYAAVIGTNVWSSASIAVLLPPSISVEPVPMIVAAGAPVVFSVTATGDALGYQWFRAGEPLGGATGAVLSIASAQEVDGGDYAVAVSNAVGTVVSSSAVLTVVSPPVIVLQPADAKALVGNTAHFDVMAEGSQLSFSWRFNGMPLFAPSLPAVALPNVQPLAAGLYAVVVSNMAGVVTSEVASLTVFTPPATQELQSVAFEPGLGTRIRFAGDPGYLFTLDASEDLSSWTTVTNTYLPGGTLEVIDPDSLGPRFYRVRWHP